MTNQIPAKKSLGQNFLKSKVALAKMLEAGEVTNTDTVLEVGPGKGVLTERLLASGARVVAIEKDHRLIGFLLDKFCQEISSGQLIIREADILDFDPSTEIPNQKYKIIANIPYYITGIFLRKFLETNHQPESIVVMVQKEIAERILTRDGKESLLSISIKVYGEPKMIMKVGKENFSPAPKVDSAILAIKNISKKFFTDNKITEERFFEIVKAGFAHKRKKLAGNLRAFALKNIDLAGDRRAEEIRLTDWIQILL